MQRLKQIFLSIQIGQNYYNQIYKFNFVLKRPFSIYQKHFKVYQTQMSNLKGININWNINADEVKCLTRDLISECTLRCDKIANVKDFTYDSVIKPLSAMEKYFENRYDLIYLLNNVSPDKNVRDACHESYCELNRFLIEMKMRKDLFDVLLKLEENNNEYLEPEAKRYLKRCIVEGKLDGLHLNEETREKIKKLKKKISDLENEFNKNVTEENSKFVFNKEDLDGVQDDVINSLEKNENGEIIVTLKYPSYFPIMKQCKVPETRRKMFIEFNSRCVKENTPLFEEIIQLRHELANLLGFKNFAECSLQLCMAKNTANVDSFLDRLSAKLKQLLESECDILLEYKRQDCEKLNIPFDGKLRQHDIAYYTQMREEKEFKIDHTKLQEYFPLEVVLNGIFDIYQTLLGLEFSLVTDAVNYHPDVKLYEVKDKESKEILGYFYTDLHPREGKFGHAAVFGIITGCEKIDGGRELAVCDMVCNFTKPTNEKPALLTHDEVETFFHEFGHVMHHICSKAKFSKFSGTRVETDFLEAPSQMLENWVWEKESLRIMSKHYKNATQIDDTLLDDLIRSRKAGAGYFNLRQILFAKIDQTYHTNSKSNTREIFNKFLSQLLNLDAEDTEMNMVASFQHLTGGYEAKYYSYLWSEVYSQDMFAARFAKEGILNPKTGMDYRRCILEPGGTMDAKDMLLKFLGREPNEIAFLQSKGLNID